MADNSSRLVCLNTPQGRERLGLVGKSKYSVRSVSQISDGVNPLGCAISDLSGVQKSVETSWRVQHTKTTCGVASLAIVLSSMETSATSKVEEEHIFPMSDSMKNVLVSDSKPQFETMVTLHPRKEGSVTRTNPNDTTVPDTCNLKEASLTGVSRAKHHLEPSNISKHKHLQTSGPILQTLKNLETKVMQCGMTLIEIASLARYLPGVKRVLRCHSQSISRDDGDERNGFDTDGITSAASLHDANSVSTNMSTPAIDDSIEVEGCDTLTDFRSLITTSLNDNCVRLVLNYHMTTLGQPPYGGHFSPIAGYHGPTDSILIMDTWYDTTPLWAPLATVWRATIGLDSETRLSRGILVITF
eukprot:m.94235 g.94235  ORF g.94235 m.94235 type:complete len:358 (-) comp26700_c0_seq1:123-1196(-)